MSNIHGAQNPKLATASVVKEKCGDHDTSEHYTQSQTLGNPSIHSTHTCSRCNLPLWGLFHMTCFILWKSRDELEPKLGRKSEIMWQCKILQRTSPDRLGNIALRRNEQRAVGWEKPDALWIRSVSFDFKQRKEVEIRRSHSVEDRERDMSLKILQENPCCSVWMCFPSLSLHILLHTQIFALFCLSFAFQYFPALFYFFALLLLLINSVIHHKATSDTILLLC